MAAADPEVELVRQGHSAEAMPLGRRVRLTELVLGGGFLAAAVAIAVGFDAARDLEPARTALLVVLFALAIRVDFDVGAGYTSPVQVVFVPMALLTPTPLVPLLVALGWLLGRLPDLRRGRVHPDRLLLVPASCWFSVGAVLVLLAFGAQTPDWGDWPVYLLALVAQLAADFGQGVLREWLGEGTAPDLQLRLVLYVAAIDALLAPIGLLAAFASTSFDYAFLLLVPAAGLMIVFGRERNARLATALALADAARSRQEIIASASHEMTTPLAVLLGLTDRLAPGRRLDDRRQELVHATMRRELVQLRQQVRQFVDYSRLQTARELGVRPEPTPVRPVLEDVATALVGLGEVAIDADPALTAQVDRERLHQMAMSLAAAALNASPGHPQVRVAATAAGDEVRLTVAGTGPLVDGAFEEEGTAGLGLHVTRELARAQGGDVRADGTGAYVLTLPIAFAPAHG